jgi:hypothetical protein
VRVREQDLQGATGQQGLGEGPGGGAPVPRATRILKQNAERQANTAIIIREAGRLANLQETTPHLSTHFLV